MAEFDSLAQEELAQAEALQQQARDRALLNQVLDIYGQKYVAEQLKKSGKSEWSREALNRWVNGKGAAKTLPARAPSQLPFSLYRSLCRYRRHPQRV